MEVPVYNQEGKPVGLVELPERLFGLPWNPDLVHQVVVSMQANKRRGTAKVKDRSEVRGGGRKPWRQKGTGRARHGSIRSPLWRGGGVTFGPTPERRYHQKINQKMKTKALFTVLAKKLQEGEVRFLDNLVLPQPKTKEAQKILKQLKISRALISLPKPDEGVSRSFRNLPGTSVAEVKNLNPLDLLNHRYVIFSRPAESLAVLNSRYG